RQRGGGGPGDVGQVQAAQPPDEVGTMRRGVSRDKGTPAPLRRRERPPRGRGRHRATRGGWCRRTAGGASSGAIDGGAASWSSSRPLVGWCWWAAPRNEKRPGWQEPPGPGFTRGRRRSGRDERDATEVTGGHPSLGTTTLHRELRRHGRGFAVCECASQAVSHPLALQAGTLVASWR